MGRSGEFDSFVYETLVKVYLEKGRPVHTRTVHGGLSREESSFLYGINKLDDIRDSLFSLSKRGLVRVYTKEVGGHLSYYWEPID